MIVLIIYDSMYGNTQKIATAIYDSLAESHKTRIFKVTDVKYEDFEKTDLLIIGSPTYGGMAKPEMQHFLDNIPDKFLKNIKIAVFDTRFDVLEQNFALRLLMKTIGYAAPKMALILQKKGGELLGDPEGFIVGGKKGPLRNEETDRATNWIKNLLKITPDT